MPTKTGFVYKLWSLQSDEIYIGSTQCVRTRKCNHKNTCTNPNQKNHNLRVYQHIRAHGGWDTWFMNVVEQVEYTHRWELEAREANHIKTLNASLNSQIPGRTRAEYKKQYREDNKEAISEKSKQYRQTNKEVIAEKDKQYHQANRERILAHKKEKIVCECGAQVGRTSIRRHQKSKKHHDLFYKKTYDFIWS